jgi:hypothetical protein
MMVFITKKGKCKLKRVGSNSMLGIYLGLALKKVCVANIMASFYISQWSEGSVCTGMMFCNLNNIIEYMKEAFRLPKGTG